MSPTWFVRTFTLTFMVFYSSAGTLLSAAETTPVIGSGNVAVADPTVPRPPTNPCEVSLFQDKTFGQTGGHRTDPTIHYQPPLNCKGPWSKIVFEADFSLESGRQFDRTALVWLGGVNLYFGTTPEPGKDVGPNWHVERDLTDYASLLGAEQTGKIILDNWLDEQRNAIIHGSARLLFYPVGKGVPAAKTPNEVVPLGDSAGSLKNLNSPTDKLTRTLTLPSNMERIYLDLIAQGQIRDEFWYNCEPDELLDQTSVFAQKRGFAGAPAVPRGCGGGSFREVEVSVDGLPAALAPIYPWIFTGGIDPFLWRPTPGLQTLNMLPYRVDLTPFIGVLSDGAPHTIAIAVIGANHYFSVTGTLLVYQDLKSAHTTGAITGNTLASETTNPTITNTLAGSAAKVNGDILTRQQQSYVIEGYVDTSHGRVQTRVTQQLNFSNRQTYSTIDENHYRVVTDQLAEAHSATRTSTNSSLTRESSLSVSFPLHIDALKSIASDGSYTRTIDLHQGYDNQTELRIGNKLAYSSHVSNTGDSHDKQAVTQQHATTGNSDHRSSQSFQFTDSRGGCYRTQIAAADAKLMAYSAGQGCPNGANHISWFAHPDGSPDNFEWLNQ